MKKYQYVNKNTNADLQQYCKMKTVDTENIISKRLHCTAKRKYGFSLLELLVGITIGAVLILGLMEIYLNMKKSHHVQESMAKLQENARTTRSMIAKAIHSAGYFGCASKLKNQSGIQGYSSSNLPAFLQDKNILQDTDVIVIQKADSNITHLSKDINSPTHFIETESNPASVNNLWLLISDCTNTDLFQTKNYTGTPIKSDIEIKHSYKKSDTEVAQFTEIAYFVSEASYKDENGKKVYSLYSLTNGSKNSDARKQELVPGVKDMKISYGFDTNGDKLVDTYYSADQVSSWENVHSVLINLTLDDGKKQKPWQMYIALRER